MSDFSPVGLDTKPADPIGTLSSILGIQQRKQAMLLQGQELQRSQLETQQQQGVNQFFSGWNPGEHHGEDGTLDLESAHKSADYQALPGNARIAVDAKLNQLKGQQLQNKQTLVNLNSDTLKGIGQLSQAVKAHPEQGDALFQGFAAQGPDNARFVDIYGPLAKKANYNPDAMTAIAAQAQDVSSQQTQTDPVPTSFDTSKEILPATIDKATGRPTFTGQAIKKELGPTDQPAYKRAVAGATTIGGGGADIDVKRASDVSNLQKQSAALIPLTNEIDRLSREISSSRIAGAATSGLKDLGFADVAAARTQLEKDLGLVKGPLAASAGSDSRAAAILEGYPTAETPEKTTHAAMDYIRGAFKQNMARGQLLKKHGVEGFAAADDEMTRSADPLVHEAASLPSGKPGGFYSRNFGSPEEAQKFKDKVDALKKHTTYLGGSSGSGQ